MPKKKSIDLKTMLPKKTKVHGMDYKVQLTAKVTHQDIPVMGICDYPNRTIKISKDFHTPETIHSTFLHELFHANCRTSSLEQVISPDLEEIIVDTMAKVVCENFILIPKDRID